MSVSIHMYMYVYIYIHIYIYTYIYIYGVASKYGYGSTCGFRAWILPGRVKFGDHSMSFLHLERGLYMRYALTNKTMERSTIFKWENSGFLDFCVHVQ